MNRIDTSTKAADLFGTGKDGFTDGTPVPFVDGTALDAQWFNATQEELARSVESAAMPLSTTDLGQNNQIALGRIELNKLLTGMTAFSTGGSHAIHGIALSRGGVLVAVGANAEIYSSADFGATWTARTADASYTASFRAICWFDGASLFVTVGDNGEIQTSPDGATWTHRTSGVATDLKGVYATASKVVVVGAAATAQQSTNGTSWSSATVVASFTGTDITVFGSTFYACGAVGGVAKVYSSTDGTTWTNVDISAALVSSDALDLASTRDAGPAFSGLNSLARFVIVYKPDSNSWVRMNQTLSFGVALLGRALCALLVNGAVGGVRSYDGANAVPMLNPARTLTAAKLVRVPSSVADAQMLVLLGSGAGYISGLMAG